MSFQLPPTPNGTIPAPVQQRRGNSVKSASSSSSSSKTHNNTNNGGTTALLREGVFVWELSLWERLNAWLYASVLVLGLLLLATYSRDFALRYAFWLLVPQTLYVGFILDTLYVHCYSCTVGGGGTKSSQSADGALVVEPAERVIRSVTRRGAAARVVCSVFAAALNVALLVMLFIYGFSSSSHDATHRLRQAIPAVFCCIAAVPMALIVCAVIQLISIYVGWPYAAAQQRALRTRMAGSESASAAPSVTWSIPTPSH